MGTNERSQREMNNLLLKTLANVLIGAKNGIVSSGSHGSLEDRVNHTFASGDVLLVIRRVVGKSPPSVSIGLFVFFDSDHFE